MRIIGKVIVNNGHDSENIFTGPYPVGHSAISEIDIPRAHADIYMTSPEFFLDFLKGEYFIYFFPNMHLPFLKPHILSKFLISHDSWPTGIKDFDATFTTSDGRKITREYQMAKLPQRCYFWIEFPIGIDNVISCDIRVISSWDGEQEEICLYRICFIINTEGEERYAAEQQIMAPWK
ncbi:hypothetical protein ADUPG1_014182 [Aduncisulcus paluster]|uniref:Uncharacterized protein n=1 Tax=Aduncisulcus paluster TaxID=2918883 RepID=A0ABQ5KB32_9EUKA|nr:hypothetical protein ADUPG1_014182 [Aduncisulcus paluster]